MIRIKYQCQFGNNLFQYVFARQLADRFGYQLVDDLVDNPILTNTRNTPGIYYRTEPIMILDDCDRYPDSLSESTYIVDGYFQRKQFYENKELVKSYLNYINITPTNKHDICLHIRLNDYRHMNWVIHPDYYLNILEKEEFDKVYIITDSPRDPYLSVFNKYNPINISSDMKDDFYNLMGFDKVIMSNSTFAWWSMYLGSSSKIYTFKRWIEPHSYHIEKLYELDNAIPVISKYLYE